MNKKKFIIVCITNSNYAWAAEIVLAASAKEALVKTLGKHDGGWNGLEFDWKAIKDNAQELEDAIWCGHNYNNDGEFGWLSDMNEKDFAAFENGNTGVVMSIETTALVLATRKTIATAYSPTGWYVKVDIPYNKELSKKITDLIVDRGEIFRFEEVLGGSRSRILVDNLTQEEAEEVIDDISTISTDLDIVMVEN
jgi:hypothetical protein